ncbi:unnamed protein product [Somion occarium]|uniref:Uncharacterized protein n=1 Tax=Somion occarium TaxID=3059160 RepID=A0ABP1DE09_9APHY
MGSLFKEIFCCCRRGSPTFDEPDERTHLIRPTEDVLSTTGPIVDHQKLRERLGTIVRSKEGKMVNVNAMLPFNLHNRALHGQVEASSSRSARSLSGQRSPAQTTVDLPEPPDPSLNSPYSPTGDKDDVPSLQTSRSTTSLHPGDASYLPPDADPENGYKRPILNARIVRGVGGFSVGGRVGRSMTRGRTGRFGDDRIQPLTQRTEDGTSVENPPNNAGTPTLSSPGSGDDENAPGSQIATPKALHFKIADPAKISRSWGD